MKKHFANILVLSALSFLALPIFAEDAKVVAVVGKAEVQKGSDWVALSIGDSIPKGSVISTGFKSELLLKVNASNIKLGPLTRMTVEQLLQNSSENKTSLFIDSGKVNVEVNKTGNKREDFKVSSPVATASVRGTSFTLRADGTLTTHSGLVTKGKPLSTRAVIDEEEAEETVDSEEISEETKTASSETSSESSVTSETESETSVANATESDSGTTEASTESAVATENTPAAENTDLSENETKVASKSTTKASVFSATFAEGIPVFAGQQSTTSSLTGMAVSPQVTAAGKAKETSGSTSTLANRENGASTTSAGASVPSTTAASSSTAEISSEASTTKIGNLAITVLIEN